MIFEILSPATAVKDRKTNYSIYEREGIDYYCIVVPVDSVAKVFGLRDGRYVKQVDASDETFEFDLGKYKLEFEFARIWQA